MENPQIGFGFFVADKRATLEAPFMAVQKTKDY
jgi:hypothetical protein